MAIVEFWPGWLVHSLPLTMGLDKHHTASLANRNEEP